MKQLNTTITHLPTVMRRSKSAMTLIEVVIAVAILALVVGAMITTAMQMQRMAFESRLRTCAFTVAQNQIDRVLYEGYKPSDADLTKTGPILKPNGAQVASGATATHYWDYDEEVKPSATNDPDKWYNTSSKEVPILDPDATGKGEAGEVFGAVKITVNNPGLTEADVLGTGSHNIDMLIVEVEVTYRFLTRTHTISLSTAKAADS